MNYQHIQILFFIVISIQNFRCQDENISQLDHTNLKLNQYFVDMTSSQNKTYQIHQSTFNKQLKSFYFELELSIDQQLQDEIQILFALSQLISLQLNSKTKHFEADFIDKRGYYMRKKYYRIEFETSYLIDQNPIYLTIYQNSQNVYNINYRIKLGVLDNGQQKSCPFDCLNVQNHGICNKNNGVCYCQQGYFDIDCSRESFDFDLYRDQSELSPYYFTWQQTFSKQKKSAFYYNVSPSKSGHLYLKIQKKDSGLLSNNNNTQTDQDNQIGNLLIYYTNDPLNYESFEVADEYFSKISFSLTQQQLMSQQELYLEYISIKNKNLNNNTDINSDSQDNDSQSSNNSSKNSSINLEQVWLQIGFRQEGKFKNFEVIDYDITFYMKLEEPVNGITASSGTSNTIVFVMSTLLVLLITILIVLVFYLHKKTEVINQAISAINVRKSKKEQENNLILELIPEIKYTEEYKKTITDCQQDEELACSVCLCEFEINEDIRKTYCPHYFHSDCLKSWLLKQKNCPHCRNTLTPRTIKDRIENPQKFSQNNNQNQQIQKQTKQKKDYMEQIDDMSINISKVSKKSNSPNKSSSSKISSSQKNIPISQSPQKKSQNEITIPIKNNEKRKIGKFQSLFNFQEQNIIPKCDSIKKVDIIELKQDTTQKKSEIPKINIQEQHLLQDVVQITEQQTLNNGERTVCNTKNRFSILSTGTPSNSGSQSVFGFTTIRKDSNGKRTSNSQIVYKQHSFIDFQENDQ